MSAGRAAKIVAACGAIALVAVGISNLLVATSSAGRVRHDLQESAVRDVAIVPGTFANRNRPAPMLRARLEAARWALEEGHVRRILVSGNEQAGEVTAMRMWLEQHGVAPAAILADPDGTRTIATMRNAARRFRIADAIICTQEVSMNRALYLAHASGIDAVGLLADARNPVHGARWVAREALKSTLAVVETSLPLD